MADAAGNAGTAALLRNLSTRLPGSTVPLTRLIDLGPLGDLTKSNSRDVITMDAYSMLRESLSVANGQRQVALDLGASVPGLLSTKVLLAIGQRPVNLALAGRRAERIDDHPHRAAAFADRHPDRCAARRQCPVADLRRNRLGPGAPEQRHLYGRHPERQPGRPPSPVRSPSHRSTAAASTT
ncbi:hypothetical protein P0F65_21495 [Sphingomonas sp. I4]